MAYSRQTVSNWRKFGQELQDSLPDCKPCQPRIVMAARLTKRVFLSAFHEHERCADQVIRGRFPGAMVKLIKDRRDGTFKVLCAIQFKREVKSFVDGLAIGRSN